MAQVNRAMAGKLAYGLLFTVLLPVALVAWAKATAKIIHSPTVDCLPLGIAFCSIAAVLIVSGWIALWVYGRGLPMNIAPPPRYVTRGIYGLIPHPVYVGFSVLCAGVSILTRSASGLWLVTPFVILACAALVLGYEAPDLAKRFGEAQQDRCRILPADAECSPAAVDRWRCYLFALLPWLVLYECVLLWGVPGDAMETYLPFEHRLPVAEWSELFYASTYILVLLSPLVAKSTRCLRKFCISAWLAMAIVFPIFLAFPFIASPKPFEPQTILGRLLAWERGFDSPCGRSQQRG